MKPDKQSCQGLMQRITDALRDAAHFECEPEVVRALQMMQEDISRLVSGWDGIDETTRYARMAIGDAYWREASAAIGREIRVRNRSRRVSR